MSILRDLLAKAVSLEASDVHIKLDHEALFRIKGELVDSGFEPVTAEDLKEIDGDLIPPHLKETFEIRHEVDFSFIEEDVGRFRVNVFMAQGLPTVAMRYVKSRDVWSKAIYLKAGTEYQFRYLIDGARWENDTQADGYAETPYFSHNSIIKL